ncbi:MAG TPA: hypothetical protein VLX56_01020 [Nitrososphaerales archaeon]|nr:hypothetical protein [Nitrososphaerales archaeon]
MMEHRRSLALAAATLVLVLSSVQAVRAQGIGSWTPTTSYPSQLAGDSCVSVGGDVYCVGGFDVNQNSYDDVFDAPVSSSGLGQWLAEPNYPTAIDSAACVNVTTSVTCVGGEDGPTVLNDVYSATASSEGLGSWSAGASYPNELAAISCVGYSGDVYCVGGFDSNGNEVTSSYYAAASSGVASWTATTAYPLAVDSESCVTISAAIYCVAGETKSGSNQNSPVTNVYYAPLTTLGIGKWVAGPSYPVALAAPSCVAYSSAIYCTGGFDKNQLSSSDTYYWAPLSGASQWTSATPYPTAVDTSSCVLAQGYVYCVGGTSAVSSGQSMLNSAYFAPLSTETAATTTSTTPEFPAAAVPAVLAVALLAVGGLGSFRNGRRS